MNYQQALEWIHGIGRFGIKPGLERMQAMLQKLGQPQQRVKFVHVAGTNGKGSTAAMLAAMLQAAGYRVGLFTSPYLDQFNNRICINDTDISRENIVRGVEKIYPLVEAIKSEPELGQPTEFEVVTTLAFDYFAAQAPDIVILEVGLGGRLDATNVIHPEVAVITNVSLEHTQVLGSTIQEIAGEKAGIIKPGAPTVTAAANPEVLEVLRRVCREQQAPLLRVAAADSADDENDFATFSSPTITNTGQYFDYQGDRSLPRLFLPLRGAYQVHNAATALAALEQLTKSGFVTSAEHIRQGLNNVNWAGRLEVVQKNPLLVMDGAHNPGAMRAMARSLRDYFSFNQLILVLGMMADKDMQGIAGEIVPLAQQVILTRPVIDRAAEPRDIAPDVRPLTKGEVHIRPDLKQALHQAQSTAGSGDLILVTGSLYTISDARKILPLL